MFKRLFSLLERAVKAYERHTDLEYDTLNLRKEDVKLGNVIALRRVAAEEKCISLNEISVKISVKRFDMDREINDRYKRPFETGSKE